MDADDKLNFIINLIQQWDNRHSNISGRAAIILNGHAILLAAIVFLLDKSLFGGSPILETNKFLSIGNLVKTLSFLMICTQIISVILAFASTGWIFNNSKKKLKLPPEKRLFFHATSTLKTLSDISNFEKSIELSTEHDLITYASNELYNVINLHHIQYTYMRRSIYLLAASLGLFLMVFTIVIYEA